MPSMYLYAINAEGRLFGLSSSGTMWREFTYLGLEFKQLSAVPHFIWAIGGDRQVYVHVHGFDVPIRIKEETYENERWFPIEGFSGRLLPTDRYNFSNHDGTVDRSRDKVKLPSMAWQWEGDWHTDTTMDGQPLDHDGWTYAVDFSATYSTKKQWKSCVRRRKWIRYRRYSAMNSWCAIAPLHKDPTKEPFIVVAVGGNDIPGGNRSDLMVWAVTAHGRVMFRVGVSTTCPEGQRWNSIKLPVSCEASHVSVGLTGLLWVLLTNGKALVRTGITRANPSGDEWTEVDPPQKDIRLTQVSVGMDAVWAVTNDGNVWFRKGIKGEMSGVCVQLATGTGWVEMMSKMTSVSIAPNDQAWGIGYNDRSLYFRTGITRSELTGKKWRLINVPLQLSRASSNASLSLTSKRSLSGVLQQRHQSWVSLNRSQSSSDGTDNYKEWEEQSRSAPTPTSLKLWKHPGDSTLASSSQELSFQELYHNETKKRTETSLIMNNLADTNVNDITISNESLKKSGESIVVSGEGMSSTIKVNPAAWSPIHSVGSMVGAEAHPETDDSIFDPEPNGDLNFYGEEESGMTMYWTECDITWCKIEAGACAIDPANPPKWLLDTNNAILEELAEPWRILILNELKNRVKDLSHDLLNCERAVEKSSWIKKSDARCKLKGSSTYEDCIVELEWINDDASSLDSGTLTVLNADGATIITQFPLSEILCVVCCSEPGLPQLAIHTPRLRISKVLRLQFASTGDMEDWMANLTAVSCQLNNLLGKPGPSSIWGTTALGDVFVFDTDNADAVEVNDGMYTQNLDVVGKELPFECILQNGFGPGSSIQISANVHDDADRLTVNLVCYTTVPQKQKNVTENHDVALHFNPRLKENIIVRNTFHNGQWGAEERFDESPIKAGLSFTLSINCEDRGYRIFINNNEFTCYGHRLTPESITHLRIKGFMTLSRVVYKSTYMIIEPMAMFWRQMGGHLKKVETCINGVTWGIGNDNTAWVYTNSWGGSFLKGLGGDNTGINSMIDFYNYFVYENQRWNPVTGYTSHGLPTDRYMWSDITGRHKRTREHTKLLSMHWHWVSDWLIDFHTPGGVDRDGWQYATDFPSQYHGRKQFTDYVRRRRWYRKCQLTTSGPWQELGNTKVIDLSLYTSESADPDSPIHVWAVATNGEALYRRGVSQFCPMGILWEHIPSDQPLIGISCGINGRVWAIGKNGSACWRVGINSSNITGDQWANVEPPSGVHLKQIAVGKNVVWALDTMGRLFVRRGIREDDLPGGTCWQTLPTMPNDPIHIDLSVMTAKQGFRHVAVTRDGRQAWAISGSGIVCRRIGTTAENPAGTGWTTGIGANWQHISVGGLPEKT
ncbi:tectonin beta-propeller repeat-containing protein [Orussus abietinus]|uniref:tectonin beta-propeller repeat-containing protein n=1 Tax=Orussus abietinus TaxID=222816 RepID=UPI0006267C14|nr:tectonin beta-propeller repeat-containing protein [Orussus abietinus]XP_012270436.1 tectonin beta-propeller repeat-containing protein [Orussus abietinus]